MLDISYNQMRFQSTKEEFKSVEEYANYIDLDEFQYTKEEFKYNLQVITLVIFIKVSIHQREI